MTKQCDFCPAPATLALKANPFTRFPVEYVVCEDCVYNAEQTMEEIGFKESEYYMVDLPNG